MRRACVSNFSEQLPNLDGSCFKFPEQALLSPKQVSTHPPRILMLYGSLRERSYSKLLTLESARLLETMGAEVKVFDPLGLPQPDAAPDTHPKVKELRDLANWSEGMVWCSPERHGAMTGIMKSQIDWIPLSIGAVRPTQGKTLAVMEVSGGSQSFNAVNQMRILGRWMRMLTIPNQSSVEAIFQAGQTWSTKCPNTANLAIDGAAPSPGFPPPNRWGQQKAKHAPLSRSMR